MIDSLLPKEGDKHGELILDFDEDDWGLLDDEERQIIKGTKDE